MMNSDIFSFNRNIVLGEESSYLLKLFTQLVAKRN